MSEERKISSKKVLRFSIGTLLVIIFMVALVAASRQQNSNSVKGLEVRLNDEHDFSFLQRKDIETLLLKNRHINLTQTPIANLDLRLMEDMASTNPWVAKADIFVDNRQILQVNITQREPVARIFDVNGNSYYMDSVLHTMPVSQGYAYPAPVFTNVPVFQKDSLQRIMHEKIAYMSEVIGRDSFWHAQVTQIEVQPDMTFVLIPLFGNQRILLGDTANVRVKLDNLFAFYRNVSDKIGWDKYETLDVRYKNQVIASPSTGWIPPKIMDTATFDLEGPAITAATNTILFSSPSAVKTGAVHNVRPAKATGSNARPEIKVPVTKLNIVKARPVVPKPKPVVDAESKTSSKKKKVGINKGNNKAQSPKYIYPGKHFGNH